MESIGFTALNVGIAVVNLAYVPMLYMLRNIYDQSFRDAANEAHIMMKDPPDKQYQTYAMQDRVPPDYSKSYGRLEDDDDEFGGGGHRVTFQETAMNSNGTSQAGGGGQQGGQYAASWGDEPTQPQQPANPFKSGGGGSGSNPFRAN